MSENLRGGVAIVGVGQAGLGEAHGKTEMEILVEAAKAGCGLIQVPECYVQPHIARGELEEVLENHKAGGYHISVVYRQQQRLAPKLRAFMDFLVDLFEPPPWTRATLGSS